MRYVLGLVTGLLVMLSLSPASAQQYPPQVLGEVEVSDSTTTCPGTITVSGSGWAPATDVSIEFDGQEIARARTDATGEFAREVDIPDASLGDHTLTVRGTDAAQQSRATDTTIECVLAAGPAGVAVTGTNITVGLLLLVALVVVGISALIAGRRKTGAPR